MSRIRNIYIREIVLSSARGMAGTKIVGAGFMPRKEIPMTLAEMGVDHAAWCRWWRPLFGFTGLSAASADVARILFYIFLVLFLVLLVFGLLVARAARGP